MIELASRIRTRTSEKLSTKTNISPVKLHRNIMNMFIDRTSIETSFRRFMGKNKDTLRYDYCKCLNDKETIQFQQSYKQDGDVFDEKRQIWVSGYVDLVEDDLFIPRDDADD